MRFEIEVNMDNDAFATPDEAAEELARILGNLADGLRFGRITVQGLACGRSLRDINGNTCGRAEVTDAD